MYNDKLYEDYDFLQKHCSPELLKKLQEAYPYDSDGPAYASWLFRSGQQDSKPGSDGKTMMLDVKADGDWYVYTALDMGWEFTNRIKVTCPDGKIIIEDMDLTGEWAKAFVRLQNTSCRIFSLILLQLRINVIEKYHLKCTAMTTT